MFPCWHDIINEDDTPNLMEQVWASTQPPGVERMGISKYWWLELDRWVERENSDSLELGHMQ